MGFIEFTVILIIALFLWKALNPISFALFFSNIFDNLSNKFDKYLEKLDEIRKEEENEKNKRKRTDK